MDLIRRVMRYPQCEVFSYLDFKDMDRFLTDEAKWPGITRAYGGKEWMPAIKMDSPERDTFLRETYEKFLTERGGAKYVCSFAMFDESARLLYRLFFCTGHIRGLEEMKKAMWKVDKTGRFIFSDKDSLGQLPLWQVFTQEWLADRLAQDLRGETCAVATVKEHALTQTPCYLYVDALRILEKAGRLEVVDPPANRRAGAFRKHPRMLVRFAPAD